MFRAALACSIALSLCGCNAQVGGPPLVSGQSPQSAQSSASEPQPVNSLPPGFSGIGSGPNATAPNYASLTIHTPF
ncbi:hypothetical protein [Acidisphaera sp. L21]|uniref:hypothetical protein n=1 Tax=Acidisphaera sp. L21 TaxID=1641851 RepID=UPI00131E21DE|nr:hypothetical protein [Acidisphaera sp. L21]